MTRLPLGIQLDNVSAVFEHARRGNVTAVDNVSLDIAPGEFLTLLGASGCGKTTILRMIAGFQRPTRGRVLFGDVDVTAREANNRDVGFVFQNYALFPHLSVFENVAYGLRVKKIANEQVRHRVLATLAQVGLDRMADRMINELSGGQQQRVALARAIVIEPGVLLFDEPLSNLDAQLRVQMRTEIARIQRELKITAVYVTHDQEEAMAIADRIVIMKAGQIEQAGSAEELYLRPKSAFVAGFLGDANLLDVEIVDIGMDRMTVGFDGHRWDIATPARAPVGSQVQAVIRPEALRLSSERTDAIRGTVVSSTYLGDSIEYVVAVGSRTFQVVQSDPSFGARLSSGTEVGLVLPHRKIHLLGPDLRY